MKDTIRLTIFRDVRNNQYVLWIMTRATKSLEYARLNFDTEIAAQKAQKGIAKAYGLDRKKVILDNGVKETTNI